MTSPQIYGSKKDLRVKSFGLFGHNVLEVKHANALRAVGRSKPTDHADAEKMRNLSHPPLLARPHARSCTQYDPGLTPHLQWQRSRSPPRLSGWSKGRSDIAPALDPSGARLDAPGGSVLDVPTQRWAPLQSCFQLRGCPSLATDAAHQRRDKAASTVSKPPSGAAPQGSHQGRHAHH